MAAESSPFRKGRRVLHNTQRRGDSRGTRLFLPRPRHGPRPANGGEPGRSAFNRAALGHAPPSPPSRISVPVAYERTRRFVQCGAECGSRTCVESDQAGPRVDQTPFAALVEIERLRYRHRTRRITEGAEDLTELLANLPRHAGGEKRGRATAASRPRPWTPGPGPFGARRAITGVTSSARGLARWHSRP